MALSGAADRGHFALVDTTERSHDFDHPQASIWHSPR
jgi:hypothetical protein